MRLLFSKIHFAMCEINSAKIYNTHIQLLRIVDDSPRKFHHQRIDGKIQYSMFISYLYFTYTVHNYNWIKSLLKITAYKQKIPNRE